MPAARIAPPGYSVRPRDAVVNIGCSHGDPATARVSHVTTIDKFLGPPNLQVAGQPVQGRSGGGLFSAEGYVIGVCNAADPEDDEGLYAALAGDSCRVEPGRSGEILLTHRSGGRRAAADLPDADARARATPMHRPTTVPTSSTTPAAPIAASETTESVHIRCDAEVVCIIRSKNDPEGKSRVVTLEQASPEFLQQLVEAQRRQATAAEQR